MELNLNNIIHHITTEESIKIYPGIKKYKECWSIIDREYWYKEGAIVAAITWDNKFQCCDEYKNIRQEYRKQKLKKLQNEKI